MSRKVVFFFAVFAAVCELPGGAKLQCVGPRCRTMFDRVGPPEIITAPPQSGTYHLVVRSNMNRRLRPTKTPLMELDGRYLPRGKYGLRIPNRNRQPFLYSGFEPRPMTNIMKNQKPITMLPKLRGPRRPSQSVPEILLTPLRPSSVSVLSPVKDEGHPAMLQNPNVGGPVRSIGREVLNHLIRQSGSQDDETPQDSRSISKIVRPETTVSSTTRGATVRTPVRGNWPTGRIVPVTRPPRLGNVDIAINQEEREPLGRSIPSNAIESNDKSVSFGTADIKHIEDNVTIVANRAPTKPVSSSKMSTENLAYILIGSCTVISITFLVIVALTMHCRKVFRQKKIVKDLRKAGYFRPMAWAREQRKRSSGDSYLHGVKRNPMQRLAPFFTLRKTSKVKRAGQTPGGALRYQTVGIGNDKRIKRTTVALPNGIYITDGQRKVPAFELDDLSTTEGTCPCTGSEHISDSFDECLGCSDRRQCNCQHRHIPNGRPMAQQCSCSSQPCSGFPINAVEQSSMGDFLHNHIIPSDSPPVSGSNYLANPDGMIFWSGNNDRLI